MKTNWDLTQFYPTSKSPQIEADIRSYEKAHQDFAKKYAHTDSYIKTASVLKKALDAYEKLSEQSVKGERALLYFYYRRELNSLDKEADGKIALFSDRLTKADNLVLFFPLMLGKISREKQTHFLKDPILRKYQYYLERLFKASKHQLTEKEEKILSLKSRPSYGMWVEGVERKITNLTVEWEGKKIPIEEAYNMTTLLPTTKRRLIHQKATIALKEAADFAESEINAVFSSKKIDDELRGFKKPYSATILSYENTEKSVEALVEAVTESYDISKSFFKLKQQLLKLKDFYYVDRVAPLGAMKTAFSFESSIIQFREILGSLGSEYVDILDRFIKNGQIDAFPKKGKSGGAYCSGAFGLPTMVLLNHVASFRSFMTLAHEMGHAIHTEISKEQPTLYQHYTTSVAETASTFFESITFDRILETLPSNEKVMALHDQIESDVASIFRQIAFFNFELELHHKVRTEGFVSKEAIAKLLNDHMHAYMGKHVKLTDDDGYFFIRVSHFRRPFYVYSYAYGQLISKALATRVAKDSGYMNDVRAFLAAGNSKSPEDIFSSIGIDTRRPKIFKEGLEKIRQDINTLKMLSK